MTDRRPPARQPAPPDDESGASVLAFIWILAGFKLATVGLIFWQLSTFQTGVLLGATTWYWFPVMGAVVAAPVAFHLRLRRARAKRAELMRSEWMMTSDDEIAQPAKVRR